jgi:hypothetical protein
VPFLVSQHGFTTRQAAADGSAMLIAWSLGAMAYGALSERMGQRKASDGRSLARARPLGRGARSCRRSRRRALVALLLALAFAGGGFVSSSPSPRSRLPAPRRTVSGIANMGVMMGGMLMQPWVGFMLDRHWSGRMRGGVRVYDLAASQWGFASIFAWGVASLALHRVRARDALPPACLDVGSDCGGGRCAASTQTYRRQQA